MNLDKPTFKKLSTLFDWGGDLCILFIEFENCSDLKPIYWLGGDQVSGFSYLTRKENARIDKMIVVDTLFKEQDYEYETDNFNNKKNELLDFILVNKNTSVYCEKHNKKMEYLDTHQNRLYCEDCLDCELICNGINPNWAESKIIDYCINNEIVTLEEWKEWY